MNSLPLIVLFARVLMADAPQPPAKPNSLLATAVAELQKQEQALQSIVLVYHSHQTDHFIGKAPQSQENVYRYQAAGNQQRLEQFRVLGFQRGDKPFMIDVFDGQKYYRYSAHDNYGSIGSKGPRFQNYLNQFCGGASGLGAFLQQHAERITAEMATIDGKPLLTIHWNDESPAGRDAWEVYLDPKAGYQPRRVVHTTHWPEKQDQREGSRIETRVQGYLKNGLFFFPSPIEYSMELLLSGGQRQRAIEFTNQIINVQPNANLAPQTFRITFPKGTEVEDLDAPSFRTTTGPSWQQLVDEVRRRPLTLGGLVSVILGVNFTLWWYVVRRARRAKGSDPSA